MRQISVPFSEQIFERFQLFHSVLINDFLMESRHFVKSLRFICQASDGLMIIFFFPKQKLKTSQKCNTSNVFGHEESLHIFPDTAISLIQPKGFLKFAKDFFYF